MTFTKLSDVTLMDALMHGWVVASMFLAIGLGVMIIREIRYVGFNGFLDSFQSIFLILWGVSIPFLFAVLFYAFEVEQVKYGNITQAFDISEDRFDNIEKEEIDHRFEDGGFTDMRLTLTDDETRATYEVTFGFKESGEPFVYDRSDDVALIESLKK